MRIENKRRLVDVARLLKPKPKHPKTLPSKRLVLTPYLSINELLQKTPKIRTDNPKAAYDHDATVSLNPNSSEQYFTKIKSKLKYANASNTVIRIMRRTSRRNGSIFPRL